MLAQVRAITTKGNVIFLTDTGQKIVAPVEKLKTLRTGDIGTLEQTQKGLRFNIQAVIVETLPIELPQPISTPEV